MSVINRIEIASLLNKHGDVSTPWEAKMRHLVLNLKGQSTAMNMENGFGKTSLSDALIGMLSRDRTLIQKTKRKMSPSKDGHPWSHIRVEFSYSSGTIAQNDMLAMTGDDVGGEKWVFGMHGHSDTDAGFYFYPGRLEELPIHSITADGKLQLFSNEHIRHALRRLDADYRPKDRESWLDAISHHISRKELEQLASFQKEGGADKSQIFNAIKPRPGEKADQAFFYEVLAPQVLAGASHGETDESEEFIEELVINSGRKVSELRHQIAENSKDLDRNDKKKNRLEELSKAASQLTETQQRRDQCREQLSDQASCMAVLSRRGIPGIPTTAEQPDAEMVLAQEMAIRVGETSPLVPLSALATITGASARNIEAWFESRQLAGFRHDKTPVVYHPDAAWASGKSMRLYPATRAHALLAESHDLFKDDNQRISALELLNEATDSFFDLDTNPFRENYLADQAFVKTLREELANLKDHRRHLDRELESLQSRDKEFTDNETVYTDALKEGLFTEQELGNANDTEKSVRQLLKAVSEEYDRFLKDEGRFSAQVEKWAEFQREFGADIAPADIAQEKELQLEELAGKLETHREQEETLQQQEKTLNREQQAIERQLPGIQNDHERLTRLKQGYDQVVKQFPDDNIAGLTQRLEQRQRQLRTENDDLSSQQREQQNRLNNLNALLPDYQAFCQVFPGHQPEGLEDSLRHQESELAESIRQQEILVNKLQLLFSDLLQFRNEQPDTDPDQWLEMAKAAYPQCLTERGDVQKTIVDIERQLSDLETDPVSPGAVEVQCSQLLQAQGLQSQPLHQVITELMSEDDPRKNSRKKEWLAQAHNLLFAPVLASESDAEIAASEFARQRLPIPVFTREALQQAVNQPQLTLLGAATGYESLAVKSLLDPAFIAQWQQQLEAELAQYRQRLQDLEQRIALYAPDSPDTALARSAAEAINLCAEVELPVQQDLLANNQQRLHCIQEQLSPENRKLIRSAEQFEAQGGETAIEQYKEVLQQLLEQIEQLREQLLQLDEQLSGEARRMLDQAEQFVQQGGTAKLSEIGDEIALLSVRQEQLTEQYEQCLSSLEHCRQQARLCQNQINQVYRPGEKDLLATLDHYLEDGGPAFMANADQRKATLENQRNRAQQRASLKFDRVRAYLSARDDQQGPAVLKKQIAALKQQLTEAEKNQEAKQEEVERILQAQPQQQNAIRQVDETAHRWLSQLSQFSADMLKALSAQDPEKLEAMALFEKAEHYQTASQSGDTDAILSHAEALTEQLEQENTQELHRELRRREKAFDERHEQFRSVLHRIRDNERQLFNNTEQVRLNNLDKADNQALADLASMIVTIQEQLEKSRERQSLLEASMEGNEQSLQERLTSIIMHAADNLETLKKVAKSSTGSQAFFLIEAEIVSENGVRSLVSSLLEEIEEYQKLIRSRKAKNLPVGSEDKQKKDLQKNLRSQIYRQLFTNIRIRLKHDAIRPHGNLFSLNEDMSEGQREALSLMWLVKLSEFAIERELRSVPSQYRRKERKSSESVIILDGLFSKLSHRRLIEDSLESLRNTRGRFQMIGLIHNPNYENDPGIFPTYLVGNVIGGLQGQGGHVMVKEGMRVSPGAVGRSTGEASLFHIHVDHEGA